jgi:hypothetical protein
MFLISPVRAAHVSIYLDVSEKQNSSAMPLANARGSENFGSF